MTFQTIKAFISKAVIWDSLLIMFRVSMILMLVSFKVFCQYHSEIWQHWIGNKNTNYFQNRFLIPINLTYCAKVLSLLFLIQHSTCYYLLSKKC